MADNNIKNIFVKTLFIIGIILVILVLAFAVIKIIPRVFSSFANVGEVVNSPFSSSDDLEIETRDTEIDSGNTAHLTWEYTPEENGVYEFEYACTNYLEVELGTSEGNKSLKCDTVYYLSPTSQSASLIPTLTRENVLVDMPVTLRFVNSQGDIVTKDNIELSVKKEVLGDLAGSGSIINTEPVDNSNDNVINTTNNNTSNTTYVRPTYYGLPDLVVSNLREIDDAVVVFDVSNVGTNVSGTWYFQYEMPDGDEELSPRQPSLRPGEAIRYTLRFEDIPDGDVEIRVDPYNAIRESNEGNNRRDVEVEGDNSVRYDRNDDADLRIDELEVGYMRGSRFVEDDRIDEDDDAAIRFVVENVGGERTGSWRFEIENIPYDDDDDYRSRRQDSLRPGESREIIVEFSNPDEGDYNIKVIVDSDDDVDEERESNNDESEELEVRD